ncbi:TPA: transposase [Klebsiella pneumoniae]|nr:transposase [Klebsiella pneumoniae]HDO7188155.1 transposase [Klebsiella pneumoniae]
MLRRKTVDGSEFAGKMLDKWEYEQRNRIDFTRPGTPTDTATVEPFNGKLRQECLNENWFFGAKSRPGAYIIIRGAPILHRAG